ncbi:MAG: hypothetical protein GY754_12880 [bacterium]|nr:hypothetical protein [bacterium]
MKKDRCSEDTSRKAILAFTYFEHFYDKKTGSRSIRKTVKHGITGYTTNLHTFIRIDFFDTINSLLKYTRKHYVSLIEYRYTMTDDIIEEDGRSFNKYFGSRLLDAVKVLRKGSDASGHNNNLFYYYDKEGIYKAFQKIYVKPGERFNRGFTYGEIYTTVFKKFVRKKVSTIIKIVSKKKLLNKKADEYYAAMVGNEFNGRDFAINALKDFDLDNDHVLLGFILRRKIDGTLPVIRKIISTVLRDYDGEYFNKSLKGV